MTSSSDLHGGWLKLAHVAWYVCAALAAIVLLAAIPVYYRHLTQPVLSDPYGLGQFNVPFQFMFDVGDIAGSLMSFGLAVLLFWRKPNDRMALFVSFFSLVVAVTGLRVLDNVLTAYFGAPSTYEFWGNLQTPLWTLFICIFPDGRFVPRWTRWLFAASVASVLVVFTSGELHAIILIVIFLMNMLAVYAWVYRYRHVSNYVERQQTKWWLYGVYVMLLLAFIASFIYKEFSPPLLNPLPIFLTIAILRYRLFDIDVIIRRTLVYSILTVVLALIYFGGVVLLQQLTRAFTETSDLAIVVSTLIIAALFLPLRRRVQNAIDRRFYRRKYDAAKTLAAFSATVRDEVELEKLTVALLNVVQETMQPASASLWLHDIKLKE